MKQFVLLGILLMSSSMLKTAGAGAGTGASTAGRAPTNIVPTAATYTPVWGSELDIVKAAIPERNIVTYIEWVQDSASLLPSLWSDTSAQGRTFDTLLLSRGIDKKTIEAVRASIQEYNNLQERIEDESNKLYQEHQKIPQEEYQKALQDIKKRYQAEEKRLNIDPRNLQLYLDRMLPGLSATVRDLANTINRQFKLEELSQQSTEPTEGPEDRKRKRES